MGFKEFEKEMKEKKVTITGDDLAGAISSAMNEAPFSDLGAAIQMMLMLFGAKIMKKLFDINNKDKNTDKEPTFEGMLEKEK